MAFQTVWYQTSMPPEIIEIMEKSLKERFDDKMQDSRLTGNRINRDKRNSQNTWVPAADWVGGFLWHYISRANRENFLYDITNIDQESIQYTRYEEGEYYGWHIDSGISSHYQPLCKEDDKSKSVDFTYTNIESVRKLSFAVQLSDPDDYEGGNVQFMNENQQSYFAPRTKGTIMLFDSRTPHRVLKVTKGVRKSLVGWCVGPRWK